MDAAALLGGKRDILQALTGSHQILMKSGRKNSIKICVFLITGGRLVAKISRDTLKRLRSSGVSTYVVVLQPQVRENVFYEILKHTEDELPFVDYYEDLLTDGGGNTKGTMCSRLSQLRFQALSSPERKTLVGNK